MIGVEVDSCAAPSREKLEHLQRMMIAAISSGEVEVPEIRTEHFQVPGMYCRKVWRQAGAWIVGKVHKSPHFFMCAEGEIIAWTDAGMKTLLPGDVIECKPGTKRVTFAVKDSVGITIHKTENTDLDKIEKELIEPDEMSLFNSKNELNTEMINHQKVLK